MDLYSSARIACNIHLYIRFPPHTDLNFNVNPTITQSRDTNHTDPASLSHTTNRNHNHDYQPDARSQRCIRRFSAKDSTNSTLHDRLPNRLHRPHPTTPSRKSRLNDRPRTITDILLHRRSNDGMLRFRRCRFIHVYPKSTSPFQCRSPSH